MADKVRLDVLLVKKGLCPSRERARSVIMAGHVFVNGQRVDKPGKAVSMESEVVIKGNDLPFVSRGGLKLAKALKVFNIDLNDKTVLDVGASTGGFTDCVLQNGARKVYAVDVGYGQLAWKLRQDPRVVPLERVNIRYMSCEQLDEAPNFVTVDVSFISLTKILPNIDRLITRDAHGILLVKPQFEAGREKVGRKGVVKDPGVHIEVLSNILAFIKKLGWTTCGITYSPIKGPEGNIEYLVYFSKQQESEDFQGNIAVLVREAHSKLGKGGSR
ncbi:MAG: TlyA family RNA methyltransferase [Peptococcaceae bacterium]|nr:TlyA family RNA methyltransferase [Peptococcaceae bacterium]